MLNIYFNHLSLNDKVEMLANYGTLLETISYNDFDVALFALENDFIEIYFTSFDNRIERIEMVENKTLEKYLRFITLPPSLLSKQ